MADRSHRDAALEIELPTDPTLSVAQDLRAIRDLDDDLPVQAAHNASAQEMPGGLAMVALGPVASPEAARYVVDSVRAGRVGRVDDLGDRAADWEPPLQTLLFWSEALRSERGPILDARPTVKSEAAYLLASLGWMYDHEPHWTDFAKDVRAARRRLEDLLHDGERAKRGAVPCASCDAPLIRDGDDPKPCPCPDDPAYGLLHDTHGRCTCRRIVAIRLERSHPDAEPEVVHIGLDRADTHTHERPGVCCRACHLDAVHATHRQGGLADTWTCSNAGCARAYTADEYKTLVARDARDNATALPAVMLVQRFTVTIGQVRMWAVRGKVRRRGRDELNRMTYDVADVARLAETGGSGV